MHGVGADEHVRREAAGERAGAGRKRGDDEQHDGGPDSRRGDDQRAKEAPHRTRSTG
jgi:hypothetical protein